jgi:cyclopropane fatty-acyl-phospholipid synthase-like methyltransferase|tara:strand:+ start:147 stop:839 length:693 start_codon:yes stop_codon:yes gene_type:complete
MDFEKPEDFYSVYDKHRTYVRAEVRKKHLAEFGRNLWTPAGFSRGHRVLELGCGVGLFLAFIEAKGVRDFYGVEMDEKAMEFMPTSIRERVSTESFETFFKNYNGLSFDRIILLDVFEHFTYGEGVALLRKIVQILKPDGQIILRVPNAGSPWGLQYQFNDLTHKALYAPGNIRQLAMAADLNCHACFTYTRGSVVRRITNSLVERVFNTLLTDPPPIWSANFVAILKRL